MLNILIGQNGIWSDKNIFVDYHDRHSNVLMNDTDQLFFLYLWAMENNQRDNINDKRLRFWYLNLAHIKSNYIALLAIQSTWLYRPAFKLIGLLMVAYLISRYRFDWVSDDFCKSFLSNMNIFNKTLFREN